MITHKVVWQHISGVMKSLTTTLLHIYCRVCSERFCKSINIWSSLEKKDCLRHPVHWDNILLRNEETAHDMTYGRLPLVVTATNYDVLLI